MREKNILVIEDDDLMQGIIKDALVKEGFNVFIAYDGINGLEEFNKSDYEMVLLDMKLPKMDGISVLKKIKEKSQETIVIMMTAYGTVETAVQAIKIGAYDYITKPFLTEELVMLVKKALEFQSIKQENIMLRKKLDERYKLHNIIGKSKAMRDIFNFIEIVAPSNATILIYGESGTGKELLAETIHHLSPRREKPIIKVSCAALPETLLESELFGYEKGAFTDAKSRRIGRFELSHQGTLFLDDIDDMIPSVQVKLLRVLQEKEFERIGGTETIKVDTRIIAASKSDLKDMVQKGKFREDLYYRLNVIPIFLPPLRERKEDIPILVKYFLDKYNKETGKNITISPEVLQLLVNYDWPGNIRELENLVERVVTVSLKNEILPLDLPSDFIKKDNSKVGKIKKVIKKTEKEYILKILESTGWNKKKSADILGITRKTLWKKMKENDIK